MLLAWGDLKRVYSGYLQKMTLLKSRWRRSICRIHHFHLRHNEPCLPPKICITILFDFSWDDCNTQEKLETMVMQIWRAGGKQDALWSMWKLWMNGKCKKWQQHIPFFFTCFFFLQTFAVLWGDGVPFSHPRPSITPSQQKLQLCTLHTFNKLKSTGTVDFKTKHNVAISCSATQVV